MSAGGSQAAIPRARSFGVRVERPRARRGRLIVYHTMPLDEATARWQAGMIPRVTAAGRRQDVFIEHFDEDYNLIADEEVR